MMPPWLLYFNFRQGCWGWWLPFFLLWPLFLLAALLILPFWLLASVFLVWFPQGRAILAVPLVCYEIFCAMRGMIVDVLVGPQRISIKFI